MARVMLWDHTPINQSIGRASSKTSSESEDEVVFVCEINNNNSRNDGVVKQEIKQEESEQRTLIVDSLATSNVSDSEKQLQLLEAKKVIQTRVVTNERRCIVSTDESSHPQTKRVRFSEKHPSVNVASTQTSHSEPADAGIQVELPILENVSRIAELERAVQDKKRLLAERVQEVQNQQRLISERDEELTSLKRDLEKKNLLLAEKVQECERLREQMRMKETTLVAAATLLGMFLNERMRRNAEAQIARSTISQQSLRTMAEPLTAPACLNSAPRSTDNLAEFRISAAAIPAIEAGAEVPQLLAPTSAASVPFKGEFTRRGGRSVNGVYVDAFPLDPVALNHFAQCCNAAEFVRLLMSYCFTAEYLESTVPSKMEVPYVEQITDATLARFPVYRTRKDVTPQTLNRPTVRTFITNFLKSKKKVNRPTH